MSNMLFEQHKHSLSTYYEPGTMLRTLPYLIPIIVIKTYYYYNSLTGKQRLGKIKSYSYTVGGGARI